MRMMVFFLLRHLPLAAAMVDLGPAQQVPSPLSVSSNSPAGPWTELAVDVQPQPAMMVSRHDSLTHKLNASSSPLEAQNTTKTGVGSLWSLLEELLDSYEVGFYYEMSLSPKVPDCTGEPDEILKVKKGCQELIGGPLNVYIKIDIEKGHITAKLYINANSERLNSTNIATKSAMQDGCSGTPLPVATGIECGQTCIGSTVPYIGGFAAKVTCPFDAWGLCQGIRLPIGSACVIFTVITGVTWLLGTCCWVGACCRRYNYCLPRAQIVYVISGQEVRMKAGAGYQVLQAPESGASAAIQATEGRATNQGQGREFACCCCGLGLPVVVICVFLLISANGGMPRSPTP